MTKEINTKASEFKIIEDKKDEPKYKEVSKFVGGMVECITFPNGDLLLINEEGKLINLPLNPEATALWRATFDNDNYITGRKDFVVGPAMLIKKQALNYWATYLSTPGPTGPGVPDQIQIYKLNKNPSPLFVQRGPTTLGCIA